jgi:hypothetical protein
MQHLDDGLIQELIDGEIPSRDLPPLQAHLSACESCRARLDTARLAATEADELLIMLDEAEPAAPVAGADVLPFRRPHWSRNVAWAASLMLAVGLGYAGRDALDTMLGAPARQATDAELVTPQVRGVPSAPTTAPSEAEALVPVQPERGTDAVATAPADRSENRIAAEDRNEQAETPPPTQAPAQVQSLARDQVVPPAASVASGVGSAGAPAGGNLSGRALAEQESSAGQRRAAAPVSTQRFREATANPPGSLELADAAKSMVAAQPVDLPRAIALLGGSIKLIDGMVPQRLDAAGREVMVVYRVAQGELLLVQRRDADSLTWRLAPPPGFPADSLAALRRRVRP